MQQSTLRESVIYGTLYRILHIFIDMDFSPSLAPFQPFVLTLHVLAMALGLGGATIADIFFFRFLRDFRITASEAAILRVISMVILAAIGVAILTGAVLVAGDPAKYLNSAPFVAKTIIVTVLTLNGVGLHIFVSPALVQLSFIDAAKHQQRRHLGLRRLAFGMGAVSCVSWYATFFLAMLKQQLPADTSLSQIVWIYLIMVSLAVVGSQVMERVLRAQSRL